MTGTRNEALISSAIRMDCIKNVGMVQSNNGDWVSVHNYCNLSRQLDSAVSEGLASKLRITELEKDLEFAYKRAKVLADICKIPVHESTEVTGTILGLLRGYIERLQGERDKFFGKGDKL